MSSLVTSCLFGMECGISSSEMAVLPQGGQPRGGCWSVPTHGPFRQACHLGNVFQSQHLQNKWEFLPSGKLLPGRLIFFKRENGNQLQLVCKGRLSSAAAFSRPLTSARAPLPFICCLPISRAKVLEIFIHFKGVYSLCTKMKPGVIICSNILN